LQIEQAFEISWSIRQATDLYLQEDLSSARRILPMDRAGRY